MKIFTTNNRLPISGILGVLALLVCVHTASAVSQNYPTNIFSIGEEADPIEVNQNFTETYGDIRFNESVFKVDSANNTINVDTHQSSTGAIYPVNVVVNAAFDNIRGMMPIGSIMPWNNELLSTSMKTLPDGWMRCDGGTVNDPASPLNGVQLPNLNSDGHFLRGGSQAGVFQSDQIRTHRHIDSGHTHSFAGISSGNIMPTCDTLPISSSVYVSSGTTQAGLENVTIPYASYTSPTGTNAPLTKQGMETYPKNMSVVWIIRVK